MYINLNIHLHANFAADFVSMERLVVGDGWVVGVLASLVAVVPVAGAVRKRRAACQDVLHTLQEVVRPLAAERF